MLADAFRQAWRNFIGFMASAIAAMGTLLPLGAIVGADRVAGVARASGRRTARRPSPRG